MRAIGLDPVADTRRAFRGVLAAMSRPGTISEVPAPADRAAVAALADHEVTLATDDDDLRAALDSQGRLAAASPTEAAIVHTREYTHVSEPTSWDVRDCRRGSRLEPSGGATVIYRLPAITRAADPALTTVRLSGPGVDGTATLSLDAPASELHALADAQADYPRGVDAVFATEDRVAAIPRSATLEVS